MSIFYDLGRGGQSALRFARLRMEKRHNYVRKVAEVAVQLFISNDKPNIAGLVLAGSADFKTELSQSDMFDLVRNCQYNSGKFLLTLYH
jgi:peptide chain release factor subunit 1